MITHKYGAKSLTVDGIKFQSQLEARFYNYFRAKNIPILQLQPRFLLQEKYKTLDGRNIRKIEYVGDFEIEYLGMRIIIDAKGVQTEAFKIKRKILEYKYPIIFIVANSIKDLEEQLKN